MPRKRWVQIDGVLVENGEQPVPEGLMVIGDLKPYKNMVDGKVIEGRRQHREFLKAHRLIEVGNEYAKGVPQRKPVPLPPLRETLTQIVDQKLRRIK
jgi:hypothetical protein